MSNPEPGFEQPTTVEYLYDAANRLVRVTKTDPTSDTPDGSPEVKVSEYAYEGDGNKVAQTVDGNIVQFLNDVATALPVVLAEAGPSSSASYAYGLDLIAQRSGNSQSFYHHDGLGSVVALSNDKGRQEAAYEYDAWGVSQGPGNTSVGRNRFRFTGEELDDSTGLSYLRARWYDPANGRLLSPDPLLGLPDTPLSMNRFLYAWNNPVRLTDPAGLSPQETSPLLTLADVGLPQVSLLTANSTPATAFWAVVDLQRIQEDLRQRYDSLSAPILPPGTPKPLRAVRIIAKDTVLLLYYSVAILRLDPPEPNFRDPFSVLFDIASLLAP